MSVAKYIMSISARQNVARWGGLVLTISFTSSTLCIWLVKREKVEENIGENICGLELGRDFSDKTKINK